MLSTIDTGAQYNTYWGNGVDTAGTIERDLPRVVGTGYNRLRVHGGEMELTLGTIEYMLWKWSGHLVQ